MRILVRKKVDVMNFHEAILFPKGHLIMSVDISDCHNLRGATNRIGVLV